MWNDELSQDAKVFVQALRRDGFTVDDAGAIWVPLSRMAVKRPPGSL